MLITMSSSIRQTYRHSGIHQDLHSSESLNGLGRPGRYLVKGKVPYTGPCPYLEIIGRGETRKVSHWVRDKSGEVTSLKARKLLLVPRLRGCPKQGTTLHSTSVG